MEIKTCKECGRMFNSYSFDTKVCPACSRKFEEKFKYVKDYIRDHKDESIATVAEACDVNVKMIHKWIREGRLILKNGEDFAIACEQCGTPIPTGRWCKACQDKMTSGLSDVANKMGEGLRKQQEEAQAKSNASTYMRTKKR